MTHSQTRQGDMLIKVTNVDIYIRNEYGVALSELDIGAVILVVNHCGNNLTRALVSGKLGFVDSSSLSYPWFLDVMKDYDAQQG